MRYSKVKQSVLVYLFIYLFFSLSRPYIPASLPAFVAVSLKQLCPNTQFTLAFGCVTLSEANSLQGGIKVLFCSACLCIPIIDSVIIRHVALHFRDCFQKMGTAGIYKLSCSCQQIVIGKRMDDAFDIIHMVSLTHNHHTYCRSLFAID